MQSKSYNIAISKYLLLYILISIYIYIDYTDKTKSLNHLIDYE